MKWEVDTRKYANGEVLLLGAWQVGGAHYDGTVARGSRDKYRATCSLPGVGALGLFPTREEAKTRVVQAVGAWLLHAGLVRELRQEVGYSGGPVSDGGTDPREVRS